MRLFAFLATIALALVVLVSCATPQPPRPQPQQQSTDGSDELPMYGGQNRRSIPELKAIDDALIQATAKEFGSRGAASERFVAQGFRYYFQDDLSNAMKLFNQGWVLDANNPNVYWGFASVLNDKQDFCEARKMLERAIELGLLRPEGLADAGRLNALCAVQGGAVDAATKSAFLKRSHGLYTQALNASPDNAHVYGSWATASYWTGDYPTAWKYVKKQRALGGKPSERFIKLLTDKMREPRD